MTGSVNSARGALRPITPFRFLLAGQVSLRSQQKFLEQTKEKVKVADQAARPLSRFHMYPTAQKSPLEGKVPRAAQRRRPRRDGNATHPPPPDRRESCPARADASRRRWTLLACEPSHPNSERLLPLTPHPLLEHRTPFNPTPRSHFLLALVERAEEPRDVSPCLADRAFVEPASLHGRLAKT